MGSGRVRSSEGSTFPIARLPTDGVDRLRPYRIYIDRQYAGKLRNGATAEFLVAPGLHEMYVRLELVRKSAGAGAVRSRGRRAAHLWRTQQSGRRSRGCVLCLE